MESPDEEDILEETVLEEDDIAEETEVAISSSNGGGVKRRIWTSPQTGTSSAAAAASPTQKRIRTEVAVNLNADPTIRMLLSLEPKQVRTFYQTMSSLVANGTVARVLSFIPSDVQANINHRISAYCRHLPDYGNWREWDNQKILKVLKELCCQEAPTTLRELEPKIQALKLRGSLLDPLTMDRFNTDLQSTGDFDTLSRPNLISCCKSVISVLKTGNSALAETLNRKLESYKSTTTPFSMDMFIDLVYVEIADIRRAFDTVALWNHEGGGNPPILRSSKAIPADGRLTCFMPHLDRKRRYPHTGIPVRKHCAGCVDVSILLRADTNTTKTRTARRSHGR